MLGVRAHLLANSSSRTSSLRKRRLADSLKSASDDEAEDSLVLAESLPMQAEQGQEATRLDEYDSIHADRWQSTDLFKTETVE